MSAREQILSQLKGKGYKTQRKMAEFLGMSESQFSQLLNYQSDRAKEKLKKEFGITIIDSPTNYTFNSGGDLRDNGTEIEALKAENIDLKKKNEKLKIELSETKGQLKMLQQIYDSERKGN